MNLDGAAVERAGPHPVFPEINLEPILNYSLFAVIQVFMLVGLLGLIIPVFPGLVVMWIAALGYGIAVGFNVAGGVIFAIQTILMLAGSLGDNLLVGATARQGGVSWRTIIAALLAGIIGTFIFPPIGGLIAAPVVALLLEYERTRDWAKARQAIFGLATGFGLAYVVRLGIGIVMMILWWVWVGIRA
jgi:uncharacterized protein YqgC (DUF456 family)